MSLDLAADIDQMLADELGVAVTVGAVTDRGILDIANAIENHDGVEVQTRVTTLLVRSGVFTLSNGVSVTADSTSYKLRSWELQDDGKLTQLILSRAS